MTGGGGDRSEDLFARSDEYDAMLARGLELAGEAKPFFVAGRLDSLFASLPPGWRPRRILDFGCGIGDTAAALAERVPGAEVVGVDPSAQAVALAAQRHLEASHPGAQHVPARFAALAELPRLGRFDLCYVNGVFHHIEPAQRGAALALIHAALHPGGYLALFENNAWNPGAWLVMRRIPFDRDARPMSPLAARRMVRRAGFGPPIELRSLFYFPRALAPLRVLERWLRRLPFGAQIQVLARRDAAPGDPRPA